MDVLSPETPLFMHMFFSTDSIRRGIVFTGSDGIRYNYLLVGNGRDNDPPFFLEAFQDGELYRSFDEVLEVIEKPQNVIVVSEEPIVFWHNNKQYAFLFYYEKIGIWGDPVIAPEVKLYLRLSDDSGDNYYYIGEYISGTPGMAPNYSYDVKKEAFTTCLMWYGGGGTAVFLAVESNKLFVYEVLADEPLQDPRVIGVIKLNS